MVVFTIQHLIQISKCIQQLTVQGLFTHRYVVPLAKVEGHPNGYFVDAEFWGYLLHMGQGKRPFPTW